MFCPQCGQDHSIEEMELSFRRPDVVADLAAEERERIVQEGRSWCVLNDERFFIGAILPLRVAARTRSYNIGIWVEVEKSAFERIYQLWSAPDQEKDPPFAAKIANAIPSLPNTLQLQGKLQLTGPKTKPQFVLAKGAHPLYVEQVKGISAHRAHLYSSLGT